MILIADVFLLLIFIPAKFWMLHDLCPGLFEVDRHEKPRFLFEAPIISGLTTFLVVLVILSGVGGSPYPFGFSLGCGLLDAGIVALFSFRFLPVLPVFKMPKLRSCVFPEVLLVTTGVIGAVVLHG